jgi:hypothetical protein
MVQAVAAINKHGNDSPTIVERVFAKLENLKKPDNEHIEDQT